MELNQQERIILRELAKQYMEIAALPIHQEKMQLWKALNKGEMQRPMVNIDQLPWHELNADGSLTCKIQNEYWRNIESNLRKVLFKWNHFRVDTVFDPFITLPMALINSGYGLEISEETASTDANNDVMSHQYHNQIKTEEDILKIKDMKITYDEKATMELFAQGEAIFEGIAPVKLNGGGLGHNLAIWDHLSCRMGVEDLYYDLIDRPEFVHKLLQRITEATLSGIRQINQLHANNSVSNVCHCSYIYTDELLPGSGQCQGFQTEHGWQYAQAQLFTSVSPDITKEFEVPYINQLAQHYGMMYYGCCERLDDRLDIVKSIANVRKISCSPWSDKKNFAEKIGSKLVMSNKPTPAYLATQTFDEDLVKNDLAETVALAKANKVNLEFVLKDISTVKYDMARLKRWTQIAMEVVEGY